MEKGLTQGTIASLLNSFESNAAENAHDSTYDPLLITVTSMFAGNNENQWLEQVEEEFGSDLSNHNKEDNPNATIGMTIELDKEAKASLARKMKGKNYNLEGVDSRSSKRTHRTNMTGKTGMTSTWSVTTKKLAMDFSQNKKDLNAEQKTALLEQRLREMEYAMAAGIPPTKPPTLKTSFVLLSPPAKTVNISTTNQNANPAQIFDYQSILPPISSDKPAKESSTTMDEVGRWN